MQLIQADGCRRTTRVDPEAWVRRPVYVEPHEYLPSPGVEPLESLTQRPGRITRGKSSGDLLPAELAPLRDAIERSRWILALQPDPDVGITERYTEDTWNRAVEFLVRHALWLWNEHHVAIPAPEIGPGPNGSIDIHWKSARYDLLVNIRRDASEPAAFYGDDRDKISIKGTLDPSAYNRGLLSWFMDKA